MVLTREGQLSWEEACDGMRRWAPCTQVGPPACTASRESWHPSQGAGPRGWRQGEMRWVETVCVTSPVPKIQQRDRPLTNR